MRPAVLTGNGQRAGFWLVTHSLSGVSYHLAAVMCVNDVNLRTINPFTADPVKALHFAILV